MAPQSSVDAGQLIRSVPLLARLSDNDIRDLGRRARVRHFAPGEVVFLEGDPGDSLHLVTEGEVLVTVLSGEGEEATLARFGPGDCFGELALLDGLPRSGTARAVRPTTTFVVTRQDFLHWLSERPRAALALLETLSLRLRRTSERMTDRLFLGLAQRLAKELLLGTSGHATVTVRRTQAEIAGTLGVSRESINKTLRYFERQGLVVLGRGRVEIPDPGALLRSLQPVAAE